MTDQPNQQSPDLASAMAPLTYRSPSTPDPTAPISYDLTPLLSAVGVSSPSRTGEAQASVSASTEEEPSKGDKIRTQAQDSISNARLLLQNALQESTPQVQPVRYSPLEAAIAAVIGGSLNAASPYTSDGTKALQSFVAAKQSAAEAQYQNEVAQHTAAIQAAQQGYKMAQDEANPLFQQANAADQTQQEVAAQKFKERLQTEQQAFDSHQAELQNMHNLFMQDQKSSAEEQLQQHRILQEKLAEVLAQTGAGRALLAAQTGAALGKAPGEIVQMARIAVHATPKELADQARTQLYQERRVKPPLLPPENLSLPSTMPITETAG